MISKTDVVTCDQVEMLRLITIHMIQTRHVHRALMKSTSFLKSKLDINQLGSPPSCSLHSCLMVFTASLGSPSLFKVLWNVTSSTILSSAIPRKSLMVLCAVPAGLYALFTLHFFFWRVDSTAEWCEWISAKPLRSTFAAASWFTGDSTAGFCIACSCCFKAFIHSFFPLSSSLYAATCCSLCWTRSPISLASCWAWASYSSLS